MSAALEPPFGDDRSGMLALVEQAPEQIERALEAAAAVSGRARQDAPDLVAAGGMGGSAIGADLARGLEGDRLARPMIVVRDYHWPACVTSRSLAVLSSYSGATEETLALYESAGRRGVPRAAIAAGGPLAAACERDGVPCWRLPPDLPPRAALYASWVAWTWILHAHGLAPDPSAGWREAAALLRRRAAEARGAAVPEPHNPAKQIARALAGRTPFLYAATERLGAVALRWRQQLNENAKLLGHSALVPELDHNEIVGWERRGPATERCAVILIRDVEDLPAVALRLQLTGEYARRQGAVVLEVQEPEGGRLARIASLVHLGDLVSFYSAMIAGVDPTPIASIDAFKRRLEEERATRAR